MRFMANDLQSIAPPGNLAWDYNEMLTGFQTAQTAQTLMWPGGFAMLSDPTIADAICDRLVHNAHVITLRGQSMRKKKGLAPSELADTPST